MQLSSLSINTLKYAYSSHHIFASKVTQIFIEVVFAHHETPTTLSCDVGTQFTSLLWIINTSLEFSTSSHTGSSSEITH